MKRLLCLLLVAATVLPAFSALADMSRFNQAPTKTKIYEATTEKSITLLYGDYRYTAGSLGMIYADRSPNDLLELPVLAVYFVHNGNSQNKTLTITTDKKIYKIVKPSDLEKAEIPATPNAISVAVGPSSIAMFRDMVKSKNVKIVCGPAKNQFEIILTEQKKALLRLIVQEYTEHIAGVYAKMDRVDAVRYVERTAPEIQTSNVKKTAVKYGTLKLNASGAAVRKLQRYLIYYGCLTGTVDGKYSKKVETAVKKYQKKVKLKQTGIADAATQKKLYAKEIPWKAAVTLVHSKIKTVKKQKTAVFCFNNVDCEYTVTGVKMVMRVLNEKGRAIFNNGKATFLYGVSKVSIKPRTKRINQKDNASLVAFPDAKSIQAGVVSYTLSDGRTVNVPTERIQWVIIK